MAAVVMATTTITISRRRMTSTAAMTPVLSAGASDSFGIGGEVVIDWLSVEEVRSLWSQWHSMKNLSNLKTYS